MWKKEDLETYKRWYKFGTLIWIIQPIVRLLLFPIMLMVRLYKWTYDIH